MSDCGRYLVKCIREGCDPVNRLYFTDLTISHILLISVLAEVSDCGRYLVISIREGCDPVNRLYFTDLTISHILLISVGQK